EISHERELMLLHYSLGDARRLPMDIVERAMLQVALPVPTTVSRTRAQFEAARERAVQGLPTATHLLMTRVRAVLAQNLRIGRALEALPPALDAPIVADLRRARSRLI